MGDRRSESRDRRESRGGEVATTSLLVRNISYRVRADELRRIFSAYGEVRDAYIPQDYYTRKPKGFAFIEFFNRRDATDALDRLEGYVIDGRPLSIVFAKDRRKTPEEMRPRYNRNDRDYDDRGYSDRGPPPPAPRRYSRSRSRERGGGRGGYDDRHLDRGASPPVPRRGSPSPPDRRGGGSSPPPPRKRATSTSRSPSRE